MQKFSCKLDILSSLEPLLACNLINFFLGGTFIVALHMYLQMILSVGFKGALITPHYDGFRVIVAYHLVL